MKRTERAAEIEKLYFYKDVAFEKGFNYFLTQIKSQYPEESAIHKFSVIFLWDSISYEFLNKNSMKSLDSLAEVFGKHSFNYVFATEMEQKSSESFLNRSGAEFKNTKLLYNMDNFISGLYNNKEISLKKTLNRSSIKEAKGKHSTEFDKSKHKPFYLIMNDAGKVLYYSHNYFLILKDTTFLNRLNSLKPENLNY